MVSNEEVVMKDTFAQFRQTIASRCSVATRTIEVPKGRT